MITISHSLFAALVLHLLLLVSTLDLDLFEQQGTGGVARSVRVTLVPQQQGSAVDSVASGITPVTNPEAARTPHRATTETSSPEKPEPKPELKPEPKPEPKPELKPELKPEPKPKPEPDKVVKPASASAPSTPDDPRPNKQESVDPLQADARIETGQHGTEPGSTPVQTPSGVAANSADRLANIAEAYKRSLLLAIEANKRYPRVAQRRGVEGQVEVAFVVRHDGTLQQLAILNGSGSQHLDRAALQTLTRLDRFMPIPDELSRHEWPMRVILRFALQ